MELTSNILILVMPIGLCSDGLYLRSSHINTVFCLSCNLVIFKFLLIFCGGICILTTYGGANLISQIMFCTTDNGAITLKYFVWVNWTKYQNYIEMFYYMLNFRELRTKSSSEGKSLAPLKLHMYISWKQIWLKTLLTNNSTAHNRIDIVEASKRQPSLLCFVDLKEQLHDFRTHFKAK